MSDVSKCAQIHASLVPAEDRTNCFLLELPAELLETILSFSGPQELVMVAASNKHLNKIAIPFLYRQDAKGEYSRALRWAVKYGLMVTFNNAAKALKDVSEDVSNKVDIADMEGKTPLHYAAYCHGNVVDDMVEHLVKLGAFLDAEYNGAVGTPLELACENQNFRAAMALIKAGAKLVDGLLAICVSSIKAKSAGGLVPEESACFQKPLILELVKRGASINWWPPSDENGQTALMRAVCNGEVSTVQLLLKLGAGVNSPGGNNTTPLMCAVQSRRVRCVKILLEAGADTNLLDKEGVLAAYDLPLGEIDRDTADIWTLLLRQGSNIWEEFWYPEYDGFCSILELAIYEALQGKCLVFDLIVEHTKPARKCSLENILKLLENDGFNPVWLARLKSSRCISAILAELIYRAAVSPFTISFLALHRCSADHISG